MKQMLWGLGLMCALTGAAGAADFFPLAVGNVWRYQSQTSGETREIRVSTPFVVNGVVYYSLVGYGTHTLLVRRNDDGNLAFYNTEHEREELLTSFEVVEGAWFEAPARECQQEGQPQARRVIHAGAAGTWNEALEIRYRTFSCA